MTDMGSRDSTTSLSNASEHCSSTDQDIQCVPYPDDTEEQATEAGAMSDSSYESDDDPISYHAFLEFPTPQLLQEANAQYSNQKRTLLSNCEENVLPFPSGTSKRQIFCLSKYNCIDQHSIQAPPDLMHKTLQVRIANRLEMVYFMLIILMFPLPNFQRKVVCGALQRFVGHLQKV